jgi:hypothetical protein
LMALENGTYISDLVVTNPTSTDQKVQGDDHLRLIKSTVKASFPAITGAVISTQTELNVLHGVTATTAELNKLAGATITTSELNNLHGVTATTAELNYTVGLSSAAQTQLTSLQGQINTEVTNRGNADNLKAPIASPTFTGTVTIPAGASISGFSLLASPTFTGTPAAPTATPGTNTTQIATTAFVNAQAYSATLPNQSGHAGQFITTDGSNVAWASSPVSNQRLAKSSGYTCLVGDTGSTIDCTSSFTLTFSAAATLGAGWFCYVKNSGTGDITIDPNGAETIDGVTSFICYPEEIRLICCDGSTFRSLILCRFMKTFSATGTFYKPPGYSLFSGMLWSGGNSGERTNSASTLSRGGGGGGCFPFSLPSSLLGSSETITIGAGGTAVTTVANGNIGGTSTLGSLVSVSQPGTFYQGGSLGARQDINLVTASGYSFAAGGAGNGPQIFAGGGSDSGAANASGGSFYGGGAGGSLTAAAVVKAAGVSNLGGNGGAAVSASNGTAGTVPGGGGGATQTGTQSGAGAAGQMIIWGS